MHLRWRRNKSGNYEIHQKQVTQTGKIVWTPYYVRLSNTCDLES